MSSSQRSINANYILTESYTRPRPVQAHASACPSDPQTFKKFVDYKNKMASSTNSNRLYLRFPADRTDSSDVDHDLDELDSMYFENDGYQDWNWDEYQEKVADKLMEWHEQGELLPDLSRERGIGKRWSKYYHDWTNGNAIVTDEGNWEQVIATEDGGQDGINARRKVFDWEQVQQQLNGLASGPPTIPACTSCESPIATAGIPPPMLQEAKGQDLERGVVLPCGHLFCDDCILELLRTSAHSEPNGYLEISPPEYLRGPQRMRSRVDPPSTQHSRRAPARQLGLPLRTAIAVVVDKALTGNNTRGISWNDPTATGRPPAPSCPECRLSLGYRGCHHATQGAPIDIYHRQQDLVPAGRIPQTTQEGGSGLPYVCDLCALRSVSLAVDNARYRVFSLGKGNAENAWLLNQIAAAEACLCWSERDESRTSWGRWMWFDGRFHGSDY